MVENGIGRVPAMSPEKGKLISAGFSLYSKVEDMFCNTSILTCKLPSTTLRESN